MAGPEALTACYQHGRSLAEDVDGFSFGESLWSQAGRHQSPQKNAFRPGSPDTVTNYDPGLGDTWSDVVNPAGAFSGQESPLVLRRSAPVAANNAWIIVDLPNSRQTFSGLDLAAAAAVGFCVGALQTAGSVSLTAPNRFRDLDSSLIVSEMPPTPTVAVGTVHYSANRNDLAVIISDGLRFDPTVVKALSQLNEKLKGKLLPVFLGEENQVNGQPLHDPRRSAVVQAVSQVIGRRAVDIPDEKLLRTAEVLKEATK